MLIIKYLRPEMVFNVTTAEGLRAAQNLEKLSLSNFGCPVELLPTVNPFDEQQIRNRCEYALQRLPQAEWIMNVTSAPKVVSIFAYGFAHENNIPCWFLHTDGGEVISLVKGGHVDNKQLFTATVEEYMSVYERTYEIRESESYRKRAESWYNISQILVRLPEATQTLLKAMREAQQRKKRNDKKPLTLNVGIQAKPLIQQLTTSGALTIDNESMDILECMIPDNDMRIFLDGDWLEVYVYKEAQKAGFADDCRWGYKIFTGKAENELDLALTHRGLLLIAECKTDDDPFTRKRKYLDTLDTNANLLGRTYVSKLFITNHLGNVKSYKSFNEQAKERRIRVVTGNELPDIGNILKSEITTPTFKRI